MSRFVIIVESEHDPGADSYDLANFFTGVTDGQLFAEIVDVYDLADEAGMPPTAEDIVDIRSLEDGDM